MFNKKIYIGNLDYDIKSQEISNKFKKYGNIIRINIKTGFAFVQYETNKSALLAIQNENKTYLGLRRIKVSYAKKRKLKTQYTNIITTNKKSFKVNIYVNETNNIFISNYILIIKNLFKSYGMITPNFYYYNNYNEILHERYKLIISNRNINNTTICYCCTETNNIFIDTSIYKVISDISIEKSEFENEYNPCAKYTTTSPSSFKDVVKM